MKVNGTLVTEVRTPSLNEKDLHGAVTLIQTEKLPVKQEMTVYFVIELDGKEKLGEKVFRLRHVSPSGKKTEMGGVMTNIPREGIQTVFHLTTPIDPYIEEEGVHRIEAFCSRKRVLCLAFAVILRSPSS